MTDEIKDKVRNRLLSLGINSNDDVDDIFKRWSEHHRFYHGMNHLTELIERLIQNDEWDNDKLFLTIIFHDIIYEPNLIYDPERPYFNTNESNSTGYYMPCYVRGLRKKEHSPYNVWLADEIFLISPDIPKNIFSDLDLF
jgi:hypothetical protein